MQVKGLMHVHSNFSDGDLSLEEIKEKAQKLGASFVLIADHMEMLGSEEKANEMVRKCQQLSDNHFLMVPGMEISFPKDYHILIYNCQQLINSKPEIQHLVDFPFTKDQFLVLAHASQYPGKLPRQLAEKLDGVEIWNARYDSRYAPNIKAIRGFKNDGKVLLAGTDAHSSVGLKKLWVEMEVDRLEQSHIFDALRESKFKVNNGFFLIDIGQEFSLFQETFFLLVNYFFAPLRITYAFLMKRGFHPPSFFRKIFNKFF